MTGDMWRHLQAAQDSAAYAPAPDGPHGLLRNVPRSRGHGGHIPLAVDHLRSAVRQGWSDL
jgi:hypothetical protein